MVKVSVIIATFNRANYVTQTLDSALAQTYKDYEIIVINDGSTDETENVLKPYLDRIKYFYQENQGISAARNFGVMRSEGEYLAFLDDDDLWLPEKLQVQMEFLDDNPDLAFVSCGTYVIDGDGQLIGTWEKGSKNHETFDSLIEANFIFMLTVLVKKTCFDSVGGFDNSLKCCNDYELWLKLAKRYKFAYINRVLAKYREHAGGFSKNLDVKTEDRLNILNRKEYTGHYSFIQKRIRISKELHDRAGLYAENFRYRKAALLYLRSFLNYPLIGRFYWPKEAEKMRFSLPYRILKVYFLVIICFFIGLFHINDSREDQY